MSDHPSETDPMTPFEIDLVRAVRAFVADPALQRPASTVVAGVLGRRVRSRWWLVPSGIAAAVLLIAAGIAGISALTGQASSPATAIVDGREYGVSVVHGLQIDAADLTPAGRITGGTTTDWFNGDIAYAVSGIDPSRVLVVPSFQFDVDYLVLIRDLAAQDLCPLYAANALPPICVRASPQREVP